VKGSLGRLGARTHEPLVEATGRALVTVTARDARGLFEHCGYRVMHQLLMTNALGILRVSQPS
jgi:hypothetical protein